MKLTTSCTCVADYFHSAPTNGKCALSCPSSLEHSHHHTTDLHILSAHTCNLNPFASETSSQHYAIFPCLSILNAHLPPGSCQPSAMLMCPPSIPPCLHYPAASSRCSCRSNAPYFRHSAMTHTPFLCLPSFHCGPMMTTTCSLPVPSQYPTMLARPCCLTMLLLLKCALLQVFCHDTLSPRLSSISHHSTVLPR